MYTPCPKKDDRILNMCVLCRCDECMLCYHFGCLDPPMKKTPKQRGYSWHCEACDPSNSSVSIGSANIMYITFWTLCKLFNYYFNNITYCKYHCSWWNSSQKQVSFRKMICDVPYPISEVLAQHDSELWCLSPDSYFWRRLTTLSRITFNDTKENSDYTHLFTHFYKFLKFWKLFWKCSSWIIYQYS